MEREKTGILLTCGLFVRLRVSGAFNPDQIFHGNKTATDYFKILLQDRTTALIGSRYDAYHCCFYIHYIYIYILHQRQFKKLVRG